MKKTINTWPRLPKQKKDTYFHIRWIFTLTFTFGFLPWVLFAYWPYCQEWLNQTFDKSDQLRTGWIMLMIGCAVFPVLLWYGNRVKI